MTDFEKQLDSLMASYEGKSKKADVAPNVPPETNLSSADVYRDATAGNPGRNPKQPKSPISMISKPPASDLPNGVGSLNGNGNPIQVIGRGYGGMDVTAAFRSVRQLAREESLKKLGFKKKGYRFQAFHSNEELNREKILGFAAVALKNKVATSSLEDIAQTPLFKKLATDLGPSTLSAITDTLSDILFPAAKTGLGIAGAIAPALMGNPIGPHRNDFLIHAPMTYRGDYWRKPTDI